jgi:hypothetical protein
MDLNVSAGSAYLIAQGAADELQAASAYRQANDRTEDAHSHRRQERGAEYEQSDAQPGFQADQSGGNVARLHAGCLRLHEDPSFPLQ